MFRCHLFATLLAAMTLLSANHELGAADALVVPRIVTQKQGTAEQIAHLAGCRFVSGVFFIHPDSWREELEPGMVYLQSPQPGSAASAGQLLCGWQFRRADREQAVLDMPDLRSRTYQAAQRIVEQADLSLVKLSDVPADQLIVDQYPKPGQKVYAGTTVLVHLLHTNR